MKAKKIYFALCLMLMALVSLSLFSISAAAADDTAAQPSAGQEQTFQSDDLLLKGSGITGKTIAIAVGVSVVGTAITVFLIWHSYKTNGQSEPYTYKKNAPLELTHSEDVHVDTIVNRRKIERDNR